MGNEKHRRRAMSPSPSLQQVLKEVRERGGFQMSVLTSTEGLPIVTAPPDYDSDLASAMVALLQRASNETQGQLGIPAIDEIVLRSLDRTRLVCRRFVVDDNELILIALVPPGRPYRRVMNWAVRRIRQAIL